MKKAYFVLFVFLFSSTLSAQNKGLITRYVYCDISVAQTNHSKITLMVDSGEVKENASGNVLKDEKGKAIEFNSIIHALNYMSEKGWEFVQTFDEVKDANWRKTHFLLRKRAAENPTEEK